MEQGAFRAFPDVEMFTGLFLGKWNFQNGISGRQFYVFKSNGLKAHLNSRHMTGIF